ncbi:hypothetical protein N0V82_010205 [Gnomoniopsis sp. IMI 355080]|nr:hypothetical protein N0V82_010205 [Gnomoniopsis sp. IMI 355080]
MIWFVLVAGLIAGDVGLGLGLHAQFVAEGHAVSMVQLALAIDIMYIWCIVWSKLSLIALYYRVFGFGYFKSACWVVAMLVVAWAIASTISLFLLCVPLAKYWNGSLKGHCSDPAPVRLRNSIATIITDVMILCLPIPQIWGLHGLRVTDRFGLTIVFAVGLFVVSIATMRIFVQQYDQSNDKSFTLAPDAGWLLIEMAAAIVSASFPAMGPAVIEIWRYLRHVVKACRGSAAHGKAARTRRQGGVELRTRIINEEAGGEGVMGSSTQHPDEVDGSFHRLYSKGQNGSAATQVGEHTEPMLPSERTKDFDDGSSSLPVTVQSDRASEEVPLSVMLQQTRAIHSDAQ